MTLASLAGDHGYDTFASNEDGDIDYVEYQDDDGGGKSFCGACLLMIFGCLLFPASLVLLGLNEKNSVCENRIPMMAEDKAVVGDCKSCSAVEGKFAFFSCPISTNGLQTMTPLTSFNLPGLKELVSFKSAAASQTVEMYQCIETKVGKSELAKAQTGRRRRRSIPKEMTAGESLLEDDAALLLQDEDDQQAEKQVEDGSVMRMQDRMEDAASDYRYRMGWAGVYYDSRKFKATPQNIANSGCKDFLYNGQANHNPTLPDRGDGHPVELGTQTIIATNVVAGPYTVSDETEMKKFTTKARVDLTAFKNKFSLNSSSDNIITAVAPASVAVHPGKPHYLGSCKEDRLGCIRISYNVSDAKHISVIGHAGAAGVMSAEDVRSKWGCKASKFIMMLPTELTKEQMITEMRKAKDAQTWGVRLVGLLLAWFALYCCFDPIASAAEMMGQVLRYIPGLGEMLSSMLEGVVTMFLCLISCGFGLSCGLLVIGIVWCAMRPIIGAPLLVGAIVLFIFGVIAAKKSDQNPRKMRKHKQLEAIQQAPSYR